MDKYKGELLIIDMLDTDIKDIRTYKEYVRKIVTFDDRGDGSLEVDYVINAIVPVRYSSKHVLSGREYMIYNQEVERYALEEKNILPEVKRILVSFGGSDPMDYTNKMDCIFDQFPECEFNIVIGPNYKENKETMERLRKYKNVRCIWNCSELAGYIYNADLCIISGGITLYETSYIGTPCIVLCQVEHQIVTADMFEINGCCINLKIVSDFQSLLHTIHVLRERDVRAKMSSCQKQFISDNGTNRILCLIQKIEEELK